MVTKRHAFLLLGAAPETGTNIEQEQHGGGDQGPEAAGCDRPCLTEPNKHSPERQASHREHRARDRPSCRPTTGSTAQMLHHLVPFLLPLIASDTDRTGLGRLVPASSPAMHLAPAP
jgi:hypothetical protein